ncbi:hypothetical protein PAPHI01_0509 [Pancytospora philotis]|nr:hypothetical protein PAPHI01_0509 [Pancytospora philotis]
MLMLSSANNIALMIMSVGAVIVDLNRPSEAYRSSAASLGWKVQDCILKDASLSYRLHDVGPSVRGVHPYLCHRRNQIFSKEQFDGYVDDMLQRLYTSEGYAKVKENSKQRDEILFYIYELASATSDVTTFDFLAFASLAMYSCDDFFTAIHSKVRNDEDSTPRGLLGIFTNGDFKTRFVAGLYGNHFYLEDLRNVYSKVSIRIEFELFRERVKSIPGPITFMSVIGEFGSEEERDALAAIASDIDLNEEAIREEVRKSLIRKYALFKTVLDNYGGINWA